MVRVAVSIVVLLFTSIAFTEPFVWPAAWFDAAPEDARRDGTMRL